ncbi:MAG: class I SAM-dependent methyltransferase [Proteobacteria bacterium]|nr:class I SAM-dependent methyltransferase [Pseudomonadota bacterium]MBU1231693.1 class I SAM-dependent methyltransferase [Pseudomonadota bacterium]MBU1420542.1 class I SAM-dependent methyltransferase [Pseudomonadota bacterium]MBU1456105.1 class I SAM-dependent methyltransferase [Pseudomonadota bacterium]
MDIRQVSNKRKIMSFGQTSSLYMEVAKNLKVPAGGSVVEFGCGPASVVPSLLEKLDEKPEIIGIDFSTQMISIANRKKEATTWKNVHFKCMDMYELAPRCFMWVA